jgi:phage baseplate assembly protein W
MALPIYRGYSTLNKNSVNTAVYNVNLVRIDLVNEFNCRLGDRVRRPTYGSIIWDLCWDLFDDRTEKLVTDDLTRIVGNDPRVSLVDVNVVLDPDAHSITGSVSLNYIELDITEWISFTFTQRAS